MDWTVMGNILLYNADIHSIVTESTWYVDQGWLRILIGQLCIQYYYVISDFFSMTDAEIYVHTWHNT